MVATVARCRPSPYSDVMLLQTYGGPSFVVEDVASRIARRLGKRIVMHLRGGAMPEFFARHPWAGANFVRYARAVHRALKRGARRAVSLAFAA